MKGASPDISHADCIRSWAKSKAHGGSHCSSRRADGNILPISNPRATRADGANNAHPAPTALRGSNSAYKNSAGDTCAQIGSACDAGDGSYLPPHTSPQAARPGSELSPGEAGFIITDHADHSDAQKKKHMLVRFFLTAKMILFHSQINFLLVFVPVAIAVSQFPGFSPGLVFALNAIAIIPLAGLLSYATETVARKLGDSLGALLNITFGNAVELIIFIIALTKSEIRIVQASLLGSILANLLLILGMAFLLGGLRFQEQIYNATVTQMSACLLSLSVISLVLPTAFHASFADHTIADRQSLKISRGTSVILLLVYGIYLIFQLKSHAFMYKSTPQEIIDKESMPGPVAMWLDSSLDSSSSDSSDSDDSDHSRETMTKRVKRAIRSRRRRKSSVVSMENSDTRVPTRSPSFGTVDAIPQEESSGEIVSPSSFLSRTESAEHNEEAMEDEKHHGKHRYRRHHSRPFRKHKTKRARHGASSERLAQDAILEKPEDKDRAAPCPIEPRCIDFALAAALEEGGMTKDPENGHRSFSGLRGISLLPVAKNLTPTVFLDTNSEPAPIGPVPRVRYGIRRTNSLPDRLNQYHRPPGAAAAKPITPATSAPKLKHEVPDDHLSRTSATLLLLVSTGLVAACAEFMVGSIRGLVDKPNACVGEIFIGLVVLPIVGNAAEHVTAISVAMKNKMDLAIGVAVGSSIQIALFVTPLVVILGWAIGKDMTLYFTLFETVCLFVSTFIVNFLVLDGRSNYLEGALLCATYVIIGVVAFFYPNADQASAWEA